MGKMRTFIVSDPNGLVTKRTRRKDQSDPKYAVYVTKDGIGWGLHCVTQNDETLLLNVRSMLETGHNVYVTRPIVIHSEG